MSARLYLIAGEPSGDRLGAALIHALKAIDPQIEVMGLGGVEMEAAGLTPLFDTSELAIMGLVEVVPRIPCLLARISQTTHDVLGRQPDALITIDSPGFGLRVAQKVRAADPSIRTIHYVAPSVWAWRPKRADHMAQFIDHVLAILPFEPPYMEAAGMTCDFVGHPIAARPLPDPDQIQTMRGLWGVTPDEPLLLLAPGSRRGEVGRLAPLYTQIVGRLATRHPGLRPLIPVAETVEPEVEAFAATLAADPVLVHPADGEELKRIAYAAADVALVASGTITLEMAVARTPMVACYRTAWLTAAIVRRLVKVKTANLVNLVSGDDTVPEFLQEHMTEDDVTRAVSKLMRDTGAREAQLSAFERVVDALGGRGEDPASRAAKSVLAQI